MGAALAMAPFYDGFSDSGPSFRLHFGPLPSTWLEVVLGAALVAGLVGGWGRLPWRNPYTFPALLLLAGAAIGSYFTPHQREALGLLKAYFVEPMLAGVVIAWLAGERGRVRILLAGLALGALIAAVTNGAAVTQAILRHEDVATLPPVRFYRTANAVALYLVPLCAFALSLALYSDDRRERRLAWFVLAVMAGAVVLSLSRGGLGALVLVAVVVALFHPRRWLVAIPLLLGVVLAAALPPIRRRVLVELDLSNPLNTITLREALWRSALNLLRAKPFTGGGLSGFRESVAPYADPAYRENEIYPHNLFLNFWTETTLLGLVAIVWALVQAARTAVSGLGRDSWVRSLSIGLLGALVAIVVHGQVDVPYFKNDLALEFWALLGIQLGAVRAPKRE